MPHDLIKYLLPLAALGFVALRMWRHSKGRPVKPSRLWIRPAMLALFLGLAFLHPPALTPLSLAIFLAAAITGLGLGYVLASYQELTLDPATGTITSRISPVGIALFVGLFAVRYVLRIVVTGGQAPDRFAAHSDTYMMYTDAGLIFVFGLVAAQAWETKRRAQPLLESHAAGLAAKRAESA